MRLTTIAILATAVILWTPSLSAQTETEIWSATLTVGEAEETLRGYYGYADTGELSDDDFVFRGVSYTVEVLSWATDGVSLYFWNDPGLPVGNVPLTLHVADRAFRFADAYRGVGFDDLAAEEWEWDLGGRMPADTGDMIQVRLTTSDPTPTPALPFAGVVLLGGVLLALRRRKRS